MKSPKGPEDKPQSRLLRQSNWASWAILSVAGLILVGLAAYLDFLYQARMEDQKRAEVFAELGILRSNIEGRINTNIQTVMGIVAVISTEPDISQERFSAVAANLFSGETELINIGVAPDLVIRMVYPLEGNEQAIGLDYRANDRQRDAALAALDSGKLTIAGPLNLVQGGVGIIGRIPVYTESSSGEKRPWGLVSAVMDAEHLYTSSGLNNTNSNLLFAARGKDGTGAEGELFFGSEDIYSAQPETTTITLPNGTWELAAVPREGWHAATQVLWGIRALLAFTVGLVIIPLAVLLRVVQHRHDSDIRLRALFDLSPIGIALNDTSTGRFVEFNQALLEATGYNREEFAQLNYWELTPSEYATQETKQLESLNTHGRYGPYEKEYITKTGSRIPVVLNGVLIKDGYGHEFIWSIIQDISERKANEIKIVEHREQLEMVLESTEAGIWDWNILTGTIHINERWAKIFGYSLVELTPMSMERWQALVNIEDFSRSSQLLKNYWNGKQDHFAGESRVRHKDGHWVWVLESGKVVATDNNGKPTRMVGTHLDISNQKNAQLLIERSREELQKFFDLSSNLVFIAQLNDRFEKVNTAFPQILGWNESHILTHTFLNFVLQDDIKSTENALAKLNAENTTITFNNRYQTRDGNSISIIWNIAFDPTTHRIYGSGIDITDLETAQQALADTQKEVQSFFDVSDTFMAIFTKDGIVHKANQALISASEYSEDDIIGSHFTRFIDPKDVNLLHNAQQALLQESDTQPIQCQFTSKSNKQLTLLWRFAIHPTKSLYYATAIDITAQEKAKEKIQHQEFLLQEMSNQASIGAWEWNLENNQLTWSATTKALHDLPEDAEIEADTSSNFFKEGPEREKMRHLIKLCVLEGKSFNEETQVITAKGRTIWANITGRAALKQGKCVRIYGSFQDISSRKLADQQLQQANHELQSQMMLSQVIAKSLTKFIAHANTSDAFNEILQDLLIMTDSQFGFIGEVRHTDSGQQYVKTLAANDEAWSKDLRDHYKTLYPSGAEIYDFDNLFGKVINSELYIISNNVNNAHILGDFSSSHPLLDSFMGLPIVRNDQVIALACLANRDNGYHEGLVHWLTPLLATIGQIIESINIQKEKNLTEKELVSAMKAAEAAVEAKSEFLATMSHEIRTPMNGILGMLNLLQKSELTRNQQRKLDIAKNSADSLLSLINDILDFSKVDAGKLDLEVLEFDLRSLFDDLCETMALRAEEKHLELILDLADISFMRVEGDPSRIRQVLTNLLGNAIKFSQRGEVVVSAEVKRDGETVWLNANISDTGIGIPSDKLANLFTPFTQVDASTTREFGGTGLGLAICKKLCDAMGGGISVKSTLGHGSQFSFRIPLRFISQELPSALSLNDITVLLDIESPLAQNTLQKQLIAWGLECQSLRDFTGDDIMANNRLPNSRRYLVLMEMSLEPNTERLAALKQAAKSAGASLTIMPILPMNYRGDPSVLADQGFNSCIYKPLSANDLLFAINTATASSDVEFFSQPEAAGRKKVEQWPKSTRVLLVDDNAINVEVAKLMLSELEIHADVATNGNEAIQSLLNSGADPFTLILMDCQMPVMDGYAATKLIREGQAGIAYRKIPIIAMTANAMTGDRERCVTAGMSDYLSKPVNEDQLLAKLQRWIGKAPSPASDVETNKTSKTKTPQDSLEHNLDRTQENRGDNAPSPSPPSDADTVANHDIWLQDEALTMLKGRHDRLEILLKMFCDSSTERLEAIETHFADNDLAGIRFVAHSIKGSAGQLKAQRLHVIAAAVELAAKTSNSTQAQALKVDFIETFHSTVKAFRSYLNY
ncbi:PAS domain S-box protein [Aurantivibrio plasticivorans]